MSGFTDEIKNKWNQPNNGLIKLIMINVAVFIVMALLKVILDLSTSSKETYEVYVYGNLAIPSALDVLIYKPWTIITYFFTHSLGGIFHILFNMLMLYWFGQIIVEFIGSKKLVALYVLGGIAAGGLYLLLYNLLPYYADRVAMSKMVGASGSVYAIIVGAAVLTPDYRMFLLFIGPVRIKYIAAVVIFISFLGATGGNAGGSIAHLGGALFGYLFIAQLRNGRDWSVPVNTVLDFFANLFKPKPKIKVTYKREVYQEVSNVKTSASNKKGADSPDQEVIDAILDKISESGYEKLTTEEKQILFKASQKKS